MGVARCLEIIRASAAIETKSPINMSKFTEDLQKEIFTRFQTQCYQPVETLLTQNKREQLMTEMKEIFKTHNLYKNARGRVDTFIRYIEGEYKSLEKLERINDAIRIEIDDKLKNSSDFHVRKNQLIPVWEGEYRPVEVVSELLDGIIRTVEASEANATSTTTTATDNNLKNNTNNTKPIHSTGTEAERTDSSTSAVVVTAAILEAARNQTATAIYIATSSNAIASIVAAEDDITKSVPLLLPLLPLLPLLIRQLMITQQQIRLPLIPLTLARLLLLRKLSQPQLISLLQLPLPLQPYIMWQIALPFVTPPSPQSPQSLLPLQLQQSLPALSQTLPTSLLLLVA